MKFRKNSVWFCFVVFAAILALQLTSKARADERHVLGGAGYGGGGNDVPTPFQACNLFYELADKEYYALYGRVEFLPVLVGKKYRMRPHLAVDLDKNRKLMNSKRVKNPYYLLEGSVKDWEKWEGEDIVLISKAHGRIQSGAQGLEYVITLESIAVQKP